MTAYQNALNKMNDDIEDLNSERSLALEMKDELDQISKFLEDATPSEVTMEEYNSNVKRFNELAEEYNAQVNTLNELVEEIKQNYKGVM